MRIVILRHGDAISVGSDRLLSSTGISEVVNTASQLSDLVKISKCFASPKTRAQQTAKIVKEHLGFDTKIETLSDLTPSGDPDSVVSYVEATCSDDDTVLLVSHLPLVEYLSTAFVVSAYPPIFDTACAIIIDKTDDNYKYKYFVSPSKDLYEF